MSTQKYEISLSVLKNISQVHSVYCKKEKKNSIPNHFLLAVKGATYVTIATVIFSRIKITNYFYV